MQEYKGIMSGVGDKYSNANVIFPKFDAKLYNFIIGQDAILDGFKLKGSVLTKGACIAKGYRGAYDADISLSSAEKYVYGKFIIHDNPNVPDEFYVVTSATEITYSNADILHASGTYFLPIVINGSQLGQLLSHEMQTGIKMTQQSGHFIGETTVKFPLRADIVKIAVYPNNDNSDYNMPSNIIKLNATHSEGEITIQANVYSSDPYFDVLIIVQYEDISSKSRDYPKKAWYSIETEIVAENGQLLDGVTAKTQAVDDNSDKVATTKYVKEQIKKDIHYLEQSLNTDSGISTKFTTNLTVKKKAGYALLDLNIDIIKQGPVGGTPAEFIFAELPDEFHPKQQIVVGELSNDSDYSYSISLIVISTQGKICLEQFVEGGNNSIKIYPSIGYETAV